MFTSTVSCEQLVLSTSDFPKLLNTNPTDENYKWAFIIGDDDVYPAGTTAPIGSKLTSVYLKPPEEKCSTDVSGEMSLHIQH